MIPAQRSFVLLLMLLIIAFGATLWTALTPLWWAAAGIAAVALLADAAMTLGLPQRIEARRELPGSVSLGAWSDVGIALHNAGSRRVEVNIFDHHPENAEARGLPQQHSAPGGATVTLTYQIRPSQRGELNFGVTQVRILSPLGLWHRNRLLKNVSSTKVYPDFSVVTKYLLLATDHRLSQLGIRKRRRRGEGQDFHQLREYREGDALRQIDWKATARTRKLISREYQDERDQEIILLIDCGKRMLAQDDELTHFDHSLNAILLLAYVALRQGDAVGLGTFSGETRWFSPSKGLGTINRLLNAAYDLYPSTLAPDYASAALEVLARQRKRALVVVLTNLREEDSDDLIPALQTLKQRHLVLLASMREQAVQDVTDQEVAEFDDALRLAATYDYMTQRQRALEKIQANGILCTDVLPQELSVSLVNRYLEIKRGGIL
ncbi:MAG: DUF58 domain-containing protein [Gammaproteobacteria bacterium]